MQGEMGGCMCVEGLEGAMEDWGGEEGPEKQSISDNRKLRYGRDVL